MSEVVEAGGPEIFVREAAERAARERREFWLGVLESHIKLKLDAVDLMYCELTIQLLRRKLRIGQPKEVIREQTRERVGRLRERRASNPSR